MRLSYDEELVEAVVFLCAEGQRPGVDAAQIRSFHAQRERCYSVPDPDARNAAFHRCHLAWFRQWGLEAQLLRALDAFPVIAQNVAALAWRRAIAAKDEGAELFVRDDGTRNAVVALRAERFASDAAVHLLLRHELTHLADMLDPAFGYSPALRLTGPVPTPQRLVRERYRLLWDVTIDGRLARAGHAVQTPRERHERAFHRAYSFWPEERRAEVFEHLWSTDQPRHDELLGLASDPRDLEHATQPLPGAPCPLCHFPTFHWADGEALDASTEASITRQFPGWTPTQGLCDRCREIYDVATRFAYPPTVVV
jgi:hypothetical protein